MSDRTNHRRVLCFAVTGVLLGTGGCAGSEPAKSDAKGEAKTEAKPDAKPAEPEVKLAPNPGPNERDGVPVPEVAPTTAVKEPVPPPDAPEIEPDHVNEGPVEPPDVVAPVHANEGPVEPPVPDKAPPEKHVNTRKVAEPPKEPVKAPPIKVNPGPEG